MYLYFIEFFYPIIIIYFNSRETLSASVYLLEIVYSAYSKLSRVNDNSTVLFISVITLVLKSLGQLVKRIDDSNQIVKDTFGHISLCITNWVKNVIGKQFGDGFRSTYLYMRSPEYSVKKPDEFKVSLLIFFIKKVMMPIIRFGVRCYQYHCLQS